MESTSSMRPVSQIEAQVKEFRLTPRPGQLRVFRALADADGRLNIKLPTGYGKTYAAMGVYSVLRQLGDVNRMLMIVPTVAQLNQFEGAFSGPEKIRDWAIDGPSVCCDVGYSGAKAIRKHMKNDCQVFAITVQSLSRSRGAENVLMLLEKGRWLVVVDEYHHYGVDKPFAGAVNSLNAGFRLCMSATPNRPDDDNAFGDPDVSVSYREAKDELAVKPLQGHSYSYRVDAVVDDCGVKTFTTSELCEAAGGNEPEKIEKFRVRRKMRWSPKYVSPLVTNPIDRMLSERVRTGYPLQAIVGALCVSHAELVCEQIRSAYPSLNVDWVGTGKDGRSDKENKSIVEGFAPVEKTERPEVDVLVHVGMAGEGLDTVYVSEVIHLNAAGVNNQNMQENGRAARHLDDVVGHINFDATSGFAAGDYVGSAIMDAMEFQPANHDGDEDEVTRAKKDNWLDVPEDPEIRIVDCDLESIDSGDHTVQMFKRAAIADPKIPWGLTDFEDPTGEPMQCLFKAAAAQRRMEADQHNEKSVIAQWRQAVDGALRICISNCIKRMKKADARVEKTLFGDLFKKINGRKKRLFGEVSNEVAVLKKHYEWLFELNEEIKTRGIPTWLF